MKHVKCRNCNIEITDKMDIHYNNALCEFFCSEKCFTEKYIKEFKVIKVRAEDAKQVDKFSLFKYGFVYYSNLDDDGCPKCRKGVLMFFKMIENIDIEKELYKCNKCGHEVEGKCD